ncbi:MAG TPA: amidohydrolase family protein [Alphaproteobacteria bacterium]|nr:amidohydrolase family protein [Alphaproteobacteria bacterium]
MKTHIRCGTLFTGTSEAAHADQTVIVEGGLISHVGPTASAPAAAPGDEVRDYSRYFVMPGLVDFHTHLAYGNAKTEEDIDIYAPVEFRALRGLFMAQRVLLAGYTSMCNPGDSARVTLSIRNAINAGLFEGPRITTAGPYVTSRQGLTDWYPTWIKQIESSIGHVVSSPTEAIEEIRCQAKDGVDAIKIALDGDLTLQPNGVNAQAELVAAFDAEETARMVAEAHRLGKRVITHARGREAILYAARAGADVIFHASFMDDECLDAILENGCAICPTFTLMVNTYEFSQPVDGASKGWSAAAKFEAETAFKAIGKARKAGVKLLTGTDSGFAATPYGEWHAKELVLFVRHLGMSPGEALRAATAVTGSYLNDGGRSGTLEVGRNADIVVFDGNPLADIAQLLERSRIEEIFLGGKPVTVETHEVETRLVSEFSYNWWTDIYTQERVRQLSNQIRSISAH